MLSRPTLLPGLRPLWRDRYTLQLGTDPAQAVVLELPHPAAARLLELLDGSRTERALLAEMARVGMRPTDVSAVIAALAESGLVVAAHTLLPAALAKPRRDRLGDEAAALAVQRRRSSAAGAVPTPASILRRRDAARVIVTGQGRLAHMITQALLDSGVGRVGRVTAPGATAATLAPPSGPGSAAGASGPAGEPGGTSAGGLIRATDATFLVQVGHAISARGTRRRLPHLALGVRDGTAIVGPLVPAAGGPCLHCLDLHRTDRDPAWPTLAAQLAQAPADRAPCAVATALTAVGFAAAEALAYLDGGEPSTIGTTVEINGVAPWRRRSWTPHPSCDCTRRRR
jgi:hypothetical protein